MASARRRLDADLVGRGLVSSRREALDLIEQRRVRVNGAIAEKASRQVARGDQLHIVGEPSPYVGRGALKLVHALDRFAIDPTGCVVVDAGASTGGFTDVVLQRGAARVYAIDVGHGQLHERLRADARVINLERTNIRHVNDSTTGEPADLIVGDLSFISLTKVIAPLLRLARPQADLVLLVKPQFEAGRAEVNRGGGVIRDDRVRQRVRDEIGTALIDANCGVADWTESPIHGTQGNLEYLVHATTPQDRPDRL